MKKILVINVLLAIALGSCSEDVTPLRKLKFDKKRFEDPSKNFPPPPVVNSEFGE